MSENINISGPYEGSTANEFEYNMDLPIPINFEPTPPCPPPFPPFPPVPPIPPKGVQGSQGVQGPRGIPGLVGPQGIQGIMGRGYDPKGYVPSVSGLSPEAELGDVYTVGTDDGVFLMMYVGANVGDTGPNNSYKNIGRAATQGPVGTQGLTGPQGPIGPAFEYENFTPEQLAGLQGPTGLQGLTGGAGIDGAQGAVGAQGLQGEMGLQGKTGPQGQEGEMGPQGYKGLVGPDGPMGLQGLQGISAQGVQGEKGLQGFTGPQGPIGAGERGPQGIQGLLGIQGYTGTQGSQGIMGLPGNSITGPQGSIGIQGYTGPQGVQGIMGLPGEAAAQGAQGFTGIQGPVGEQGPQGIAGVDGNSITGPQGPIGIQGERGPEFKYTDFTPQQLADLQGEQGPQGIDGIQGITGEVGPQGADGLQGAQGPTGEGGILVNPIVSSVDIGGISIGDAYQPGTDIEQILSDLLQPTINPTFVDPSASLSYSADAVYAVGATIPAKTGTITFNPGAINLNGTKQNNRAGEVTSYQLYTAGADEDYDQSNNNGSFNVTALTKSTKGNLTITGKVNYGQGPQPKDSKGNDYGSPLAAGSKTASKTIKFILPFWYGNSNSSTVNSLSGLTQDVTEKSNKTYRYTTNNQYMVIAYDSTYGNISNIMDANNFDVTSGWTKTTLTVEGYNYNVYVSNSPTTDTNAAFTFKF